MIIEELTASDSKREKANDSLDTTRMQTLQKNSDLWSIGLLHNRLTSIEFDDNDTNVTVGVNRRDTADGGGKQRGSSGGGGGGVTSGVNTRENRGGFGERGNGNDNKFFKTRATTIIDNSPYRSMNNRDETYAENDDDDNEDENNYRNSQLSKSEYKTMEYMGILNKYLESMNNNNDANGKNKDWKKCEQQKWRFKITFFIVYTIFTVTTFFLIYNMLNYYALIVEIINMSVTYLLLLHGL